MKYFLQLLIFIFFTVAPVMVTAQEDNLPADKVVVVDEQEEAKEVKRKVEKAEKEARLLDKKEKEAKKVEKLKKEIKSREKSIDKDAKKAIRLQNKIEKGKIKGTLAPVDIQKMEEKILDLNAKILKNKGKLDKLKRKQ
ncbi:hypothetical protein [Maribacter aestuarii]|uniref:hypothetical protein n=1 Tax=Maribacter aestuarii TaxID=1130723 RepID=UPI00248D0C1A|nr:hypothetical protein [Maribacter aestuarii]